MLKISVVGHQLHILLLADIYEERIIEINPSGFKIC